MLSPVMIQDKPMLMVRMRCPACLTDGRILIEVDMPLVYLPEVTKKMMRCRCDNHIPKIGKNTPLEKSLMSINGVPLGKLKKQMSRINPALPGVN